MKKRKNTGNRNKQSNYLKLSIFQPNKYKFKRSCPLSAKGAPVIDYKNTKLFPILGSLIDMFKNLNLVVKESEKTLLVILKEDDIICNFKIQKKKV